MSAPLLTLPQELLDQIVKDFKYPSFETLRQTCKSLRHALAIDEKPKSAQAESEKAYTMADLLVIETWPRYGGVLSQSGYQRQVMAGRDHFACSICLKIRCASKFSNAMMKGEKGKYRPPILSAESRFCIPCAIKHQKYRLGQDFDFGGASSTGLAGRGFICKYCKVFSRVEDRGRHDPECLDFGWPDDDPFGSGKEINWDEPQPEPEPEPEPEAGLPSHLTNFWDGEGYVYNPDDFRNPNGSTSTTKAMIRSL